jgi:hypothetical protein
LTRVQLCVWHMRGRNACLLGEGSSAKTMLDHKFRNLAFATDGSHHGLTHRCASAAVVQCVLRVVSNAVTGLDDEIGRMKRARVDLQKRLDEEKRKQREVRQKHFHPLYSCPTCGSRM